MCRECPGYFLEIGPGFQPENDMEKCSHPDEDAFESHSLNENQLNLIRKEEPNAKTIHTFLKEGIQNKEKKRFRELPELEPGDQLWIYRDSTTARCNPIARIMP